MEILGRGFIAANFTPIAARHPGAVLLAAGVSSTASASRAEFAREEALLRRTIDRCRTTGRTLVFFSTASAGMYGSLNQDGREDGPVFPRTPYGRHKLALEQLLSTAGVRYLILRISHLVGPCQRPHQLVPALIVQIGSGCVRIHLGARRDLIDIQDMVTLVDGLLAARVSQEVVNIASGVPFPVEEIVHRIEDELGRAARHEYVRVPDDSSSVSIEKLHSLLPGQAARMFGPGYPAAVLDKYVAMLTRVYFEPVGGNRHDK